MGWCCFLFLQFSDYPIEKMVVALSVLSPVDLSRIMILLLRLDVSAMMGMTGAVFQKSFGTDWVLYLLLYCCVGFGAFRYIVTKI
jgi:Cu-processing system permease protein